jgi:hypothetical protein
VIRLSGLARKKKRERAVLCPNTAAESASEWMSSVPLGSLRHCFLVEVVQYSYCDLEAFCVRGRCTLIDTEHPRQAIPTSSRQFPRSSCTFRCLEGRSGSRIRVRCAPSAMIENIPLAVWTAIVCETHSRESAILLLPESPPCRDLPRRKTES